MARHRNVRSMNYEDEYYDEDEMYGHSFDDSYCVSPGTAAQFTFNRDRSHDLSSFMGETEGIPEEEDGDDVEESPRDPRHRGSQDYTRPQLSDVDEAKLNSCLEEMRNVLGDSVSEQEMVDTAMRRNFSLESTLNELLTQQDKPKPQREPRQNRRNRSQESDDDMYPISESPLQEGVFSLLPATVMGHLMFGLSVSPQSPSYVDKGLATSVTSKVSDSRKTEGKFFVEQHCLKDIVRDANPNYVDKDLSVLVKDRFSGFEKKVGTLIVEQHRMVEPKRDTSDGQSSITTGKPSKKLTGSDSNKSNTTNVGNISSINGRKSKELLKSKNYEQSSSKICDVRELNNMALNINESDAVQKEFIDMKLKSEMGKALTDIAKAHGLRNVHDNIERKSETGNSVEDISTVQGMDRQSTGCKTKVGGGVSLADLAKSHGNGKQVLNLKPSCSMPVSQALSGMDDKTSDAVKPKSGTGISLADLAKSRDAKSTPGSAISLASLAELHSVGKQNSDKKLENKSEKVGSRTDLARLQDMETRSRGTKPEAGFGISLSDLASLHGIDKRSSGVKSTTDIAMPIGGETKSVSGNAPEAALKLNPVVGMSSTCLAKVDSIGKKEVNKDLYDLGSGKLCQMDVKNKTGLLKPQSDSGKPLSELTQAHLSDKHSKIMDFSAPQGKDKLDKNQTMISLSDLVKQHGGKVAGRLVVQQQCAFSNVDSNKENSGVKVTEETKRPEKRSDLTLADLAKAKKSGRSNKQLPSEFDNVENSGKASVKTIMESDVTEVMAVGNEDLEVCLKEIKLDVDDDFTIGTVKHLVTEASAVGKALCLRVDRRWKGHCSEVMYKKKTFQYKNQVRIMKSNSPVHLRKIVPFIFNIPSPDDIVKSKQKMAFTRSGERKPLV